MRTTVALLVMLVYKGRETRYVDTCPCKSPSLRQQRRMSAVREYSPTISIRWIRLQYGAVVPMLARDCRCGRHHGVCGVCPYIHPDPLAHMAS